MSPLRKAGDDKVSLTREAWIGLGSIAILLIGGLVSVTSRLSAVEAKVDVLMQERRPAVHHADGAAVAGRDA